MQSSVSWHSRRKTTAGGRRLKVILEVIAHRGIFADFFENFMQFRHSAVWDIAGHLRQAMLFHSPTNRLHAFQTAGLPKISWVMFYRVKIWERMISKICDEQLENESPPIQHVSSVVTTRLLSGYNTSPQWLQHVSSVVTTRFLSGTTNESVRKSCKQNQWHASTSDFP